LFWLRAIFLSVTKIIGAFFALGFLVMALVAHALVPTLLMGMLAFGVFILRQKYDLILLKLNPTGHELYLWQ
jgi:hypothetical protein